jgi:hypothetical protein
MATDTVVTAAKSIGSFLAIDMFFNISQTCRMIDHFNQLQLAKTMPTVVNQNSSGLLTTMIGIVLPVSPCEREEIEN